MDGLHRDFASMWNGYREALAWLPEVDQRKIFHDNAVRIYKVERLKPPERSHVHH